jgi:hypothetical protein
MRLADVRSFRSLVYVEGDASMRQYETKEGKQETALSVVHRKSHYSSHLLVKFFCLC